MKTEKELFRVAWAKWGDLQWVMVIEEASELQKCVTKILRGKGSHENLAEEIADLEIMLAQVKENKPLLQPLIEKYRKLKIERLEKMLEKPV